MANKITQINIPDMLTDFKSFDVGSFKLSSFDTFFKVDDCFFYSDQNKVFANKFKELMESFKDDITIVFFTQTNIKQLHGEFLPMGYDNNFKDVTASELFKYLSIINIFPSRLIIEFRYALNDNFIIFKKNEKKA